MPGDDKVNVFEKSNGIGCYSTPIMAWELEKTLQSLLR